MILGFFLSMAIPSYVSRINQARYEKTVNELTTIAQASVDYFNLTGSWPDPTNWVSQLYPNFIPDEGNIKNAVTSSPFKTPYNVSGVNNMVTVYVLIPAGIAKNNPQQGQLWTKIPQGSQDEIEITQTVQNESTAHLSYMLNNPS